MPISIDFKPISKKIIDNTLLLTPNSRTQKALIAGHLESLQEGEVVYALDIQSFSHWITYLWEELSFIEPLPTIVGNLELKTWLKEQISADSNWQLTNELGVAEKLLEAYQTLSQWGLSLESMSNLEELNVAETVESQYFVHFIEQLEIFLAEKRLLPRFQQLSYLLQNKKILLPFLPKKIILVGFNQLTPIEQIFLDFCKSHQVEIDEYSPRREQKETQRVELSDLKEAICFSAKMASKITQQYPDANIGIVVHQLSNHLNLVHQIFSEEFQPDEALPWQSLEKIRYNVSAGQPLLDMPMISVAIKLLSLDYKGVDLQTLYLLKNSPFIEWGESVGDISAFLHDQCMKAYQSYSYDYLLQAIKTSNNAKNLFLLESRLNELQKMTVGAKPMNVWVDWWKSRLSDWGWGTTLGLEPSEEKQMEEFYSAMIECANLTRFYPTCYFSQAKDYLLQHIRQRPFQLPSDRTNVHVLGVLEAAGLEFDYLILTGFQRDNWPQKATLNPFLSVALQQSYQMPGSSAEKEYQYSKSLSESLLAGADYLWVTQFKDEEAASSESPFFSEIPLVSITGFEYKKEKQKCLPDYFWLQDEKINLPDLQVKGGAYLLSQYAACPFRALSNFQFNLKVPEKTQLGIQAKVKGAWLHKALELLWLELQTQENLLSLSDSEVSELVTQVLIQAQQKYESQLYARADEPVIQLEFQKLHQQILQFLALDKTRESFSVVPELKKSLTLGKLSFEMRIDRIDYSDQQTIEIIDYKTGNTDFNKWMGARPEEAQMPAYVIACQTESITSLNYAKIKTGEVNYSGVRFKPAISSANESMSNIDFSFQFYEKNQLQEKDKTKLILSKFDLKPDANLLTEWKLHLTQLADNIACGNMPVSPLKAIETCRYCEFSDFCRINEEQPSSSDIQLASTALTENGERELLSLETLL